MSKRFKKLANTASNPYGNGSVSKKITNILEKLLSKKIEIKKNFIDNKI